MLCAKCCTRNANTRPLAEQADQRAAAAGGGGRRQMRSQRRQLGPGVGGAHCRCSGGSAASRHLLLQRRRRDLSSSSAASQFCDGDAGGSACTSRQCPQRACGNDKPAGPARRRVRRRARMEPPRTTEGHVAFSVQSVIRRRKAREEEVGLYTRVLLFCKRSPGPASTPASRIGGCGAKRGAVAGRRSARAVAAAGRARRARVRALRRMHARGSCEAIGAPFRPPAAPTAKGGDRRGMARIGAIQNSE